ncbi:MAG TPA: MCE family protein [Mycobacteriales bacterium]|nr:MCE family protein [Mycobacteriales bacterium]HVX69547.1 MCE family protein [Mycobacteriales bacterium]HWA65592.1 MCE family protein [Mycobacteriales bacterium]
MRPFRERSPLPIGIAGVVVIIILLLLALDVGSLPFITSGHTVYAEFTDSASLQSGDNVKVAGVQVGKVTSVKLMYVPGEGNIVRVGMKVSGGPHIGADTTANIKIETLLGQVYVALNPTPSGSLADNTIPVDRTTTPTSITEAFIGLGKRAGEIDVKQLAKSFDVLSDTFKNTPGEVHASLVGLERVSEAIASRNNQLTSLLGKANDVTTTIASHDDEITKLIDDSSLILQTISQQRAVVHQLLVSTAALAHQLTGLVAENRKLIGPALAKLDGTLRILRANQRALDETLHLAAPFVRDFTDTLGTGRWFESTLTNLTDSAGKLSLGNSGNR